MRIRNTAYYSCVTLGKVWPVPEVFVSSQREEISKEEDVDQRYLPLDQTVMALETLCNMQPHF
jgi:hypothetical protein